MVQNLINEPIQSIYIHYPFCKKKCAYCDFISFANHEKFIESYHKALCNEITTFGQSYKKPLEIKTLFFGGGTPSMYPLHFFTNLFETLHNNFSLQNLKETTIEANPEDVTQKHLETYKSLGINRLSIGVQILNETILRNVNRYQTNECVKELLTLALHYFKNISVDLILGLPGTTTTIWFDTLEYLISQQITHISVYFLTIYEKTPIYFAIKNGTFTLPDEEWLTTTYEKTVQFLEQKNFLQYEISNFAKPGFSSMHNKVYWTRLPYQGFGLSAASFKGKKRLVNSNNLIKYLNYWKTPGIKQFPPCYTQETITPQNVVLEELMLGLRQKQGVDLHHMVYLLRECLSATQTTQKLFEKKVKQLKKQNLLEEKNGRIFLTTRGMVLENKVITQLLP